MARYCWPVSFLKFDGFDRNSLVRLNRDYKTGTNRVYVARGFFSPAEHMSPVEIVVVRSGDTNSIVMVDYTTRDGLAAAGQDYIPQAGTLIFAPGERLRA